VPAVVAALLALAALVRAPGGSRPSSDRSLYLDA
jgi:hypothetical protein